MACKWTGQKRQAAELLGRCVSVRATAAEIGVHFTTVQRWKSEADFMAEVFDELRDHVGHRRVLGMVTAGKIADRLEHEIQKRLSMPDEQRDLPALRVVLAEYRKFRQEEWKGMLALGDALGLDLGER